MYNSARHEKTVPMARIVIANPRGSSCLVLDILLLITGVFAIFGVTFDEKIALIWKSGPQEKFGVFQTMLVEDAICESKCILKIYDYYIHAKELYSSTAVYAFDFLYGGQMSLVDYEGTPVSRGDLFINRILTVLNGAS